MNKFLDHIWLASYPRSGNTFLRSVLFNCFNLRSGSIYPRDLGYNKKLEEYAGHIEQDANGSIDFQDQKLKIIKTHNYNNDHQKTIYVIRDARPSSLSMYKFYNKKISLDDIILGNHRFGKWSDHILNWDPLKRNNTLLIKYESLLTNFNEQLNKISFFLNIKIVNNFLPDRNEIADDDGKWVNRHSNWKEEMPASSIDLCNKINKELLIKFNYI